MATIEVLLVEDNSIVAAATANSLRRAGFVVVHAWDIEHAVKMITGHFLMDGSTWVPAFEPDVVVLDLGLPWVNGVKGFPMIRKVTSAPIIAYTGSAGDPFADRDLKLVGFAGVVAKPDVPSLLLLIQRATSHEH